jgi:protease-4
MHRSLGREVFIITFKAFVVLVTLVIIIVGVATLYETNSSIGDGSCNVAVLPIEGTIMPYAGAMDSDMTVTPDMVNAFMDGAEKQDNIEAVLVEINSPGGTPVAAERIAQRLHSSSLPTVGLIGDIGASGGYMIAASTNYLIASTMSDVGSIGVNMSYVENSKQNDDNGLTYVHLTAGKFKDAGSPEKPITDEERDLFQKDLDLIYDEFVNMVANYRHKSVDDIKNLANGATMVGSRALENGLIDKVGGRTEAKEALAKMLNKNVSAISFCEYQTPVIGL